MTKTTYWLSNITLDLAVAAMILTAATGNTLAEAVLGGLVWLVILGHAVVAIGGDKTMATATSRPAGYWLYHIASETALISGLWLIGFQITALCYLVALAGFELALRREPRTGNEQSGVAA
ncbi:hypothetical protein NH8B_0587 [Pseudogulbenkiania sp. NH8B]|uniref:hypothetical protein n=1 Tax=Pseudogulbenkiania sp. (strain NH8B) TaxID=748280 RepID=UPI000227958B|nr:hypothetical protein [Pseudogulbenkiania sp. NH8B]BAK75422.1 hypothetical protein NH8B_0587 [Pseudogulbenkiania sp. NH8B]